jgi:hypothetical protein
MLTMLGVVGNHTKLLESGELLRGALSAYLLAKQEMIYQTGGRRRLSVPKVCTSCGRREAVWVSTVRMQIHKFGRASILCQSCSKSEENNGRWIGGVRSNGYGYIYERCLGHPNATLGGCVMQHRLVIEKI